MNATIDNRETFCQSDSDIICQFLSALTYLKNAVASSHKAKPSNLIFSSSVVAAREMVEIHGANEAATKTCCFGAGAGFIGQTA